MPQLDLSTFPSQIFWLVLTFAFLYIVMARVALPTVREVLHDRKFKISDNLDKAEKMKNEAQQAYQDFTSSLNDAREKSSLLIQEANSSASKLFDEKNAELDIVLKKQLEESETKISNTKQEVIDKMSEVLSEVSSDFVKNLIGVDVEKELIKSKINNQYYN